MLRLKSLPTEPVTAQAAAVTEPPVSTASVESTGGLQGPQIAPAEIVIVGVIIVVLVVVLVLVILLIRALSSRRKTRKSRSANGKSAPSHYGIL